MVGAAKRVLIVEDDDGIREALAECVTSLGIEVATARDGQEALERLRAATVAPDVLLVDLRMPRLDGHGLLAALHADEKLARIPVVSMTAWNERPRVPVRAHLSKPFDLDELARLLSRLGIAA